MLLGRTLVSMHESLLRDLYNILQRVFDPKPLNPKPILLILNQYIYNNPLFNQTEPDLTTYISELKIGIAVRVLCHSTDRRIRPWMSTESEEVKSWIKTMLISFTSTILRMGSSMTLTGSISGSRIQYWGTVCPVPF